MREKKGARVIFDHILKPERMTGEGTITNEGGEKRVGDMAPHAVRWGGV